MGACVNIWWDASDALRAGVIVFWLVVIALYPTTHPPTHPLVEKRIWRGKEEGLLPLLVVCEEGEMFRNGRGEARRKTD